MRRTALVHDWLVHWGGSEVVLRELADLFPEAPIHTSVYRPDARVRRAFGDRDIRATHLDRIPAAGRIYRGLLPLMPAAFRALDLTEFDLVISSSHAFSKAVRVRPEAVHVCYCHTPPRYLWDLADFYNRGVLGRLRAPAIPILRRWDRKAAEGVHHFVANSSYVADRIHRTYDRDASVVHPPVDVARFRTAAGAGSGRGDYFLAGGRMVAYKELSVTVEAANQEGFRLKLFGDGPARGDLERRAGPTVEFVGPVPDEELPALLAGCRAFLYPGVEDFGILPVEAQAAGSPVVARNEGGARETVVDGVTGVLYDEPGVRGLVRAIRRFEEMSPDPEACERNAERFRPEAFRDGLTSVLESVLSRAATEAR